MVVAIGRGNQISIGLARLTTGDLDPLVASLRLENALGTLDLRPRGLPPAAILCIRRLRDPLPGTLDLRSTTPLTRPAWESAARTALDDRARRAARPFQEPVAANADAVLFADEAELLACMALDWASGAFGSRWWWRAWLKNTEVATAILTCWRDRPQAIPTALAHLWARNAAIPFVTRLNPQAVTALGEAIATAYGLPVVRDEPAIGSSAVIGEPPPDVAPTAARTQVPHIQQRLVTLIPALSTVMERLNAAPAVPAAAQGLLIMGAATHFQLTVARSLTFTRAMARWQAALIAEPEFANRPVEGSSQQTRDRLTPPVKWDGPIQPPLPIAATPAGEITSLDTVQTAVNPRAIDSPAQPPAPAVRVERDAPISPASGAAAHEAMDSLPPAVEAVHSISGTVKPTAPLAVERATVETAFGGLFYLLNVALALRLYGDFTQPAGEELALSPWDLLALLGEEWFGASLYEDPLWGLLAELAGREEKPPGNDFQPPNEWRLRPDWLAAFPEPVSWRWHESRGRLRVWHPAGFWVVDQLIQAGSEWAGELDPYGAVILEPGNVPRPRAVPLRRWLDWLSAYTDARLCRALGTRSKAPMRRMLARQAARVIVSATRVDVLFDLNSLPIAVRLAGLDRDPGWIPAAGRAIAFHFSTEETPT